MKGKSARKSTRQPTDSKTKSSLEEELPSILEKEKMKKVILEDKPASFYQDFYSRLTAAPKNVNSTTWMHEKEKEWLFSKCNPSIPSSPFTLKASSATQAKITACHEDFHQSQNNQISLTEQNSLLKSYFGPNESPDLTAVNLLLNELANEGNVPKMHQLLLEMTQNHAIAPNVPSLTLLLKGYAYSGKVELALLLFARLKEAGAKLHQIVYIWMMEGLLGQNHQHSKLMELYWEAKQVAPPNNNLCAVAIKSCGKAGEVEKAFLVYEELLNQGIRPNDVLLTSLLYACCQRKDYYSEAFEIVKQLESYGYSASLAVYNHLLLGCAKSSDLKVACKVWEELCQQRKPTAVSVTHFLYTLASVETDSTKESSSKFIYSLFPEEIVAKAMEIYNNWIFLQKSPPTSHILSALLACLCKNRQVQQAKAIFYDEHAKWQLERHSNSYESMFQLFEKTKDLASALELRKQAQESNVPLTLCAHLSLVGNAAQAGEIEIGLELVREMIIQGEKPFYHQISKLVKAAIDAEKDDVVEQLRLICKSNHVPGSSQKIFAQRNLFINSLLDEVYGPERGRSKERTKQGMQRNEEKKLINPGLYKELLAQ